MLRDAGEIGLPRSELDRLMPFEFALMIEGYDRRREWTKAIGAQVAAWVMTPICGTPITAAMLLTPQASSSRPSVTVIDPRHYPTREDFSEAVRAAQRQAP